MNHSGRALPECARLFLQTKADRRTAGLIEIIIWRFHNWLERNGLRLSDVRGAHIESFSSRPYRRDVAPSSARQYARRLNGYLRWLHQRGDLLFDPGPLRLCSHASACAPPGAASAQETAPTLPEQALRFLQDPETIGPSASMLRRFHLWLAARNLGLAAVSIETVRDFTHQPRHKLVCEATAKAILGELVPYLVWLHAHGELALDPTELIVSKRPAEQLPQTAQNFLRTPEGRSAGPVVRRFHTWLHGRRMLASAVTAADIDRFFKEPFRNLVRPRIGISYRRGLYAYLLFLDQRGALGFDPRTLGVHRRVPLPPIAQQFLRTLEPTLKPRTCSQYRNALHSFYDWMAHCRLELHFLNRWHLEQWLLSLNDRGLHATSRTHAILQLRTYLRWLRERDLLKADPDLLLRRSDLPKLPRYLPRPLPPPIDAELQRRLLQCQDVFCRGLWLARHTGVRIGELVDLSFDCIHSDALGRSFLRVPLGKLNSERLVPLTDKACEVIHDLQRHGVGPRPLLFPRTLSRESCVVQFRQALATAAAGLKDSERITPHRLRHTYATTLLSGGMSLVGVMKLLGHRDFRMTLRYTAITQELVAREYFDALAHVADRYSLHAAAGGTPAFDPIKALTDVVAWLNNITAQDKALSAWRHSASKRLLRIQAQMRALAAARPS